MSISNSNSSGTVYDSSSKLPIPRAMHKRSEQPRKGRVTRQHRVGRACLSCKTRKVKCNGEQPSCRNCIEHEVTCVYPTTRRDNLRVATTRNHEMIALLRELRNHVPDTEQVKIDDLLNTTVDDVDEAAAILKRYSDPRDSTPQMGERGEANVSAEVGNQEDLDLLDENIHDNETSRATGFVGKASEVQWLRRLHTHYSGSDGIEGPYGPPGEDVKSVSERLSALKRRQEKDPWPLIHTSKASFYLDDEPFKTDLTSDPFEVPPFETAERLLHAYFESCHNSYPLLVKKAFVGQFYEFYAALNSERPYSPSEKWRATLNLVFAIGAVYSHLISEYWQGEENDHLIYHSRAWMLSFKDPWWFSHSDLPQMQITGLLSFYYLSIGHVNRAWVLIGMALRFGIALGLHVRNEDSGAGIVKKEHLSRIWWGHFCLETLISAITGRPSIGAAGVCSVPLPLSTSSEEIDEFIIETRFRDSGKAVILPRKLPKQNPAPETQDHTNQQYPASAPGPANSGSYLRHKVCLASITQRALNLYAASTVTESWESVQQSISGLLNELETWAASLPPGLNFLHRSNLLGHAFIREQNILDISYRSTKILITRPCLCRLDRRIANQSSDSNYFNERMAGECVRTAQAVAALLPEEPSVHAAILHQAGPWWKMVHIIMQALLILLLEVRNDAGGTPKDRRGVQPTLMKLIAWLRVMRTSNGMARRAYAIVLRLFKKLAPDVDIDIASIFHDDETASHSAPSSQFHSSHHTQHYNNASFDHALPPEHAVHDGSANLRRASYTGSLGRNNDASGLDGASGLDDASGLDSVSSLGGANGTSMDNDMDGAHEADLTDGTSMLLDPLSDVWNQGDWGVPGWLVTEFDEAVLPLTFDGMEVDGGVDIDADADTDEV